MGENTNDYESVDENGLIHTHIHTPTFGLCVQVPLEKSSGKSQEQSSAKGTDLLPTETPSSLDLHTVAHG